MKLLILGASILQLPAIKKAKDMGHFVGVVDYNPNAVGINYADVFFEYSTNDIEKVLEIAKSFCPDGIMTMATDMPMRTIAYVAKTLNLKALLPETAFCSTNKLEMIKIFKQKNIESPWFFSATTKSKLDSFIEKIVYPCIIKPTDSSGSKGVVLCQNVNDLKMNFDYSLSASTEKKVIIEEYMSGEEISVEVFVVESNPNIIQITDKMTTGAPYFVETGHSQPTLKKNTIEIENLAKRAVLALGIDNGPAHVEIMCTKEGPKVIEIGARLGGDCITSHLVPLSCGVDMVESTIRYALGQSINLEKTKNKASAILFILPKKEGTIRNIQNNIDKSNKQIVDVHFTKQIGDTVLQVKNSNDRLGYVIAYANSVEEALSLCHESLLKIEVMID